MNSIHQHIHVMHRNKKKNVLITQRKYHFIYLTSDKKKYTLIICLNVDVMKEMNIFTYGYILLKRFCSFHMTRTQRH